MDSVIYYEVTDFAGYFVDVLGNVYSKWINKGIHGMVIGEDYKKLNPRISKTGHRSVQLGRKNQRYVHRLVYESIIGKIPEGLLVRHLNDDPSDNRIENLKVGTQKDNMEDCIKNGNFKGAHRVIKIEDCGEILKLKESHTWKELAFIYQVNEKTLRNNTKKYKEEVLK